MPGVLLISLVKCLEYKENKKNSKRYWQVLFCANCTKGMQNERKERKCAFGGSVEETESYPQLKHG